MKCSKCTDVTCRHRTTNAEQNCFYEEHYEEILTRAKHQTLDWQAFRREAAKDILCACLADQRIALDTPVDTTIRMAIKITDDLIEQLKEEKK